MKSSLVSRNDPLMSDHQSLMAVDPSFSHELGSFSKGTKALDDAYDDTVCPFCSHLHSFELTDVLLDESQVFSTYPTWMELANMDDSQLENLILSGDSFVDPTGTTAAANIGTSSLLALTPKHSPEHDFEEFLSTLEFTDETLNQPSTFTFDYFEASNSNSAVDLTPPLTPVHQSIQDPLSACIFESGIANFEEVSNSLQEQQEQHMMLLESVSLKSDWSSQVSSPAITEAAGTDIADIEAAFQVDEDNGDTESVQSFSTTTSRASTLKRKLVTIDEDTDEEYLPPSKKVNKKAQAPTKRAARKTPARRIRRVQDERVKNQNKVAAMKYRAKKRDEKSTMDVLYEAEEEKNKKLKSQLEELQVNIDVLKELLGKYLKKE